MIVRESIIESLGFQRGVDPKRALFGLVPGQLVKYTLVIKGDDNELESRTYIGLFLEGERNFISLGYFSAYNVSGISKTLILPGTSSAIIREEKDLEPLTSEETIIVKKALNSPRAKIMLKNIEERYNVKPILESNFERGKDSRTALFGFRPGQIVTELWSDDEHGMSSNVKTLGYYLILESGKEPGKYITTELGYKMFGKINIWSEYERYGLKNNLKLASDQEIEDIKQAYKEEPEKFKSLKKYLAIWGLMDKKTELLNLLTESVSFERGKDPKTALFGFIPGQLVKYNPDSDKSALFGRFPYYLAVYHNDSFSDISPEYASVINIGKITGIDVTLDLNPNGPYGILGSLKPLNTQERVAVIQSLVHLSSGKRIIKDLEAKWPVKVLLESNFERGRNPKHSLFGFRLGQLVVGKYTEGATGYDVDCIIQIIGDECTIASFGRFEKPDLNNDLKFHRVTGQGDWFEPLYRLRSLNEKETELMQQYLKDPENNNYIKRKEEQYMIALMGYHSELIPEKERVRVTI